MRAWSFFVLCLFLFLTTLLNAQVLISKPALGFSQACASPSFNNFRVTVVFNPPSQLEITNQFIVELSDKDGDFSNSRDIYTTATGSVTVSPADIWFSFPEDVAGENYRLRVRSTAPESTSTWSDTFSAYYKIHDTQFTINNFQDTASYCEGGSYLLTIDPYNGSNNSPLQYDSLTYNWYKVENNNNYTFIQTSESLSVSQDGVYLVRTNYGSCTSNSFSNRVNITQSGTVEVPEIESSLGNPYCPLGGDTVLSMSQGEDFQWLKDGVVIPQATNSNLLANESALYLVNFNLNGCDVSASINLVREDFSSEINVSSEEVLEDGETIEATITTDASSPEFEWYRNNNLIEGAIQNAYEITESGDYLAKVTQTEGCGLSKEFNFTVKEPFPDVSKIPNVITPNNDNVNDTWIIPRQYTSGSNTEIVILNSKGMQVFKSNNYENNWPSENLDYTGINEVYY